MVYWWIFLALIGAGLLRHLSFGWQQCVGSRRISQRSNYSTWCLPRSCITGRSLETVMVAGSVHCGLVRSDQRGNYVQPARLYSMLRNADRTTILLCVCPSGQSTKTLLWCGCDFTVGGWRTGFGLQQQWVEDGGWGDPRWVRRPDGGCCPRRCQVNSCCCSNAGLNQPPSLHPSYHPPTCLCLPAWMCASFLFTFSSVSPLAWSFTFPNCPNYLVASHLIFHLGILNSDPELFEIFFYKRAFNTKLNS